jgi:hypothetical protein
VYKSVVRFNLRSSPYVDLNCVSNEFEVDGVRVRCSDGVVTIEFEVVGESPEVVNELGRVRSELFAYAISLIQGRGFGTCNLVISPPSKVPQTTSEDGAIRLSYNVTERISLIIKEEKSIDEPRIKKTIELMSKLGDALRNPSTSKRAEELLRVVKWWVSGGLDEDPLDRFLKFFIAFELLASLMGYKGKNKEKGKKGKNEDHEEESGSSWVEEFCKKYGLTCKFEGKGVNKVRNLIMHEPGKKREEAEEVARKHADEFGREVLKAIWRVLSEELGISV